MLYCETYVELPKLLIGLSCAKEENSAWCDAIEVKRETDC